MIAVAAARTSRPIWQRDLGGAVVTIIEHDVASFEVFSVEGGRIASLGRCASRASALRLALQGRS